MLIQESQLHDFNILAHWLSANECPDTESFAPDLVILAGHAVVGGIIGTITLAAENNIPMLFTGGVGHSTELLKDNLRKSPLTSGMTFSESSEAAIFYRIATELVGINPSSLFVEDLSTNCGQNAEFSLTMIAERNIQADRILLSQDPLMQRRTRASFEHHSEKTGSRHVFLNWPVFVPQLVSLSGRIVIQGPQMGGSWDMTRFVTLVLGEMRRLNDDAEGYGPAGAGFIGHIDIPEKVRSAWERLCSCDIFTALCQR
ncbi:hypothetical protein PEC311524_12590 [Pectobacterium carotovorum subsp. carotovorum]|nr:hypothetical protein PEC311524_12590 [Pectobacterium carotovorum subsp. carotovorum]